MEKNILERIEIIQVDITRLHVDAIVNAANTSLLGGGGVDGAIHKAAGPGLLAECRKIGGCPTGEARITKGYNLYAPHVIHTVGPIYGCKPEDSRLLSFCYTNSFKLAADNQVTSIAFPAISCGVYGYPISEACEIAVGTTCNFLKDNRSILKVVFALFSTGNCEIYKNYLQALERT